LELGNYLEANEELENVTAALRAHPDVLELRYNVFALGDKWDGCLAIAETLTDQLPQRLFGWLALASAEHHLGDTESAYPTLASVAEEFAEHADFNYDFACAEADEKLKLKALADPNLAEVWKRIGSV
jgi:predicted Zn-dependent protease